MPKDTIHIGKSDGKADQCDSTDGKHHWLAGQFVQHMTTSEQRGPGQEAEGEVEEATGLDVTIPDGDANGAAIQQVTDHPDGNESDQKTDQHLVGS